MGNVIEFSGFPSSNDLYDKVIEIFDDLKGSPKIKKPYLYAVKKVYNSGVSSLEGFVGEYGKLPNFMKILNAIKKSRKENQEKKTKEKIKKDPSVLMEQKLFD